MRKFKRDLHNRSKAMRLDLYPEDQTLSTLRKQFESGVHINSTNNSKVPTEAVPTEANEANDG